jgi:hypothetical protein
MMAAAFGVLFIGVAAAASPMEKLETARRQLQDCGPSNQDLLTVIEIVIAQQSKLQSQKDMLQCLQGCAADTAATCGCQVTTATLAEAPVQGVTLHLAYQVPADERALLSAASIASLEEDCYLTPAEIAADAYAATLSAEYSHYVAGQIGSAGISASDIAVFGFSDDGDDVPGCNADVTGHTITIGTSDDFVGSLGNEAAFADCWLSLDEIQNDPDAAAFAAAFIETTAEALNVSPEQVNLNGICVGCVDANDPDGVGGGCGR